MGGIFIFKRSLGIIIIIMLLSSCSANKPNIDYTLGRSPFSSYINLSGNKVFFKSFVLNNTGDNYELAEYRYQGLFCKIKRDDEPELIYEDFSHGLNVYSNKLYFINTQHQLLEYDIPTNNVTTLAGDDVQSVSECLIINDILFYIVENNAESTCVLNSYDIKQKRYDTIANNVYWERLNHFQDNIQFWDNNGNPKIYQSAINETIEYGPFDMEVIQILDNETVIGYKDRTFIQCDLKGENKEPLFSVDNLYNVIVTQNELFYSTVDKETYTQLFRYSFSSKKSEKIATTEFPLVGYTDPYVYCASTTGIGNLQRINTNTGEIEVFDDRTRGNYVQDDMTLTYTVTESDVTSAKEAVAVYYKNTVFKNKVTEISQIEDISKYKLAVIPHKEKDVVIAFYVTMSDNSKRMIVLTKELSGEWEVINEGV